MKARFDIIGHNIDNDDEYVNWADTLEDAIEVGWRFKKDNEYFYIVDNYHECDVDDTFDTGIVYESMDHEDDR